jgi:hypothetical protein
MLYSIIKVKLRLAYDGLPESTAEDVSAFKRELARVLVEDKVGHLVTPVPVLPRETGVGGAVPVELWVALVAGSTAVTAKAISQFGLLLGKFLTRHKDLEVSVGIGDNSYSVKGKRPEEAIEIIRKLYAEFHQNSSLPQVGASQSHTEPSNLAPVDPD